VALVLCGPGAVSGRAWGAGRDRASPRVDSHSPWGHRPGYFAKC